ncbi:MAG: LysM domain-containing protein [Kiritimatiellae bacterium]|nr:LysM domain-containing protein [Kiritimatiellia bacterium]MCO5061174.1 LysM domain-containing protein [Kiritimatiellia bacterium]MCO5067764.1 LysM domain-containing protein [Kiritimatiellia bacterium]MCO6401401.1 LysM peptidoglycan-binding domain-containing protein [Verrucomicrobiota bacterium]
MNIEQGGSSSGSSITIGLAIIAIALGGVGLYLGISGRGQENAQNNRISELEQQVERLGGASEELTGQIRGLHSSTRSALQEVSAQMNQLREDLSTRAPAAASSAPAASPASSSAPAQASGKTYVIRSGDVLGKVAKQQGTTTDAILKANPGLNANRLKVGQTINLP